MDRLSMVTFSGSGGGSLTRGNYGSSGGSLNGLSSISIGSGSGFNMVLRGWLGSWVFFFTVTVVSFTEIFTVITIADIF
jgi:hypothetical protein